MDDERECGTDAVEMTEVEIEREESEGWNEVDAVKEEAGSRDTVKHVEKSDQLFVEKMM